ncbi:MAG: hypoxanthine phosphoribosyltransferase [Rhodospirillaceae bacterium]
MNDQPEIDVLFDAAEIAARVDETAREIAGRLPDDLLVVVVLKGSFIFAADLLRALDRAGKRPRVDFITLSSYGTATRSSGTVSLTRDISEDVRGRAVLLVDDILDSGRTLAFAADLMAARGAASVHTCVLLDKNGRREVEIEADFAGFPVNDLFVVGYGIDFAHRFRSLPFIGIVRHP